MEQIRTAIIIALLVINSVGIYSYIKLSPWNTFDGAVTGLKIEGDPNVAATHWYNHAFLAMWGWKTIVVLEAETDGVFPGYAPFDGKPQVSKKATPGKQFRMKIGREDCRFLAVDKDGKEVPLVVVKRTTKDDAEFADVPMY